MSYRIDEIAHIDPAGRERLAAIGIQTTDWLLGLCRDQRGLENAARKTGLPVDELLAWMHTVDLMRVRGIGEAHALLLQDAGVDTVHELRRRNPEVLAAMLAHSNSLHRLVHLAPSPRTVARWVRRARELPDSAVH